MKRQWKSTEHELAKTVKSQADMYERTVEQRNLLQEQLSRSNERRRAAGKRMQALQRKIQELKGERDLLVSLCAKLKEELGHPFDLDEAIYKLREKAAALETKFDIQRSPSNGAPAQADGEHTADEIKNALLQAMHGATPFDPKTVKELIKKTGSYSKTYPLHAGGVKLK